jgi:hypothetical protein
MIQDLDVGPISPATAMGWQPSTGVDDEFRGTDAVTMSKSMLLLWLSSCPWQLRTAPVVLVNAGVAPARSRSSGSPALSVPAH